MRFGSILSYEIPTLSFPPIGPMMRHALDFSDRNLAVLKHEGLIIQRAIYGHRNLVDAQARCTNAELLPFPKWRMGPLVWSACTVRMATEVLLGRTWAQVSSKALHFNLSSSRHLLALHVRTGPSSLQSLKGTPSLARIVSEHSQCSKHLHIPYSRQTGQSGLTDGFAIVHRQKDVSASN